MLRRLIYLYKRQVEKQLITVANTENTAQTVDGHGVMFRLLYLQFILQFIVIHQYPQRRSTTVSLETFTLYSSIHTHWRCHVVETYSSY